MRQLIKNLLLFPLEILNTFVLVYTFLLGLIHSNLKYAWIQRQVEVNNNRAQEVTHLTSGGKNEKLNFFVPNWLCQYRADTFSSKEPETLKWIDDYGDDGVLFDIGANIGLYSIYYAKTKNNNVYAFEPSFFNLPLLAKNINSNDLQDKIHIITNPLSDSTQFADFNLSSTDEGHALSAFGVNFDQHGDQLEKALSFKTLGYPLDFLLAQKILPEIPRMIKIDVDGIEHLILVGAKETLSNSICKTVLIEVNDNFSDQAEQTMTILSECGFSLKEKHHQAAGTYNQIWVKC